MTTTRGRKPKGSRPMTAAERKREQRNRERSARQDMPSWLRIRHKLWELIQREFMLDNAAEVINSLDALGSALATSNIFRHIEDDRFYIPLEAYLNPSLENLAVLGIAGEALRPYEPLVEYSTKLQKPGGELLSLHKLICDVLSCHENGME